MEVRNRPPDASHGSLTWAMRWMMTSSSFAVRCALAGSSSHLRSMVRMRCRMDGSVVPALTDCPVISITNVDRKCFRWSGDRVSASGTATAVHGGRSGWWGGVGGAMLSVSKSLMNV